MSTVLDTKRMRYIHKSKRFKELYSVLWRTAPKMDEDDAFGNLKVAIYVNPCYGFGDIIFALKFYNYIKEWYGVESTIVTTKPKAFFEGVFCFYRLSWHLSFYGSGLKYLCITRIKRYRK